MVISRANGLTIFSDEVLKKMKYVGIWNMYGICLQASMGETRLQQSLSTPCPGGGGASGGAGVNDDQPSTSRKVSLISVRLYLLA